MITPCEIIGVGSSGFFVVEKFKSLLFTVFQEGVPEDILKYVVLETDQGNLQEVREGRVDISIGEKQGVHELKHLEKILRDKMDRTRRATALEWFEAIGGWKEVNAQRAVNTSGAGAVRPSGKFSLLMHWSEIGRAVDWNLSLQQIQDANDTIKGYAQARNLPPPPGGRYVSNDKVIYVVGSLCGGTNSGVFIDLAYLIRSRLNLGINTNICGIFLVPYENYPVLNHNANVYAACKELEWVSDNGYIARWADGHIRQDDQTLPYSPVYLVASQNGEENLQDTYDKAALRLFLGFMGMEHDLGGIQVAGYGNIEKKKYLWTFNLGGVTYPKYELAEAAACSAGEDLFNGTLKEQELPEAHNRGQRDAFEEIERRVFQHCLNNLEHDRRTLTYVIDELATEFCRNIIPPEIVEERFEQYERIIRGEARNIRNQLISSLQSRVQGVFEQRQNIVYTQAYLSGVLNGIRNMNKFWSGVADVNNYNAALQTLKPEGRLYRLRRTKEKLQELANACIIRSLKGGGTDPESSGMWAEIETALKEQIKIERKIDNVKTAINQLAQRRESIIKYLMPREVETIRKVDRNGTRLRKEQIDDEISGFKRDIDLDLRDDWELMGQKELASEVKGRFFRRMFSSDIRIDSSGNIPDLIETFAQQVQDDRSLVKGGVVLMSDMRGQSGFAKYLIGDANITGRVDFPPPTDNRNGRKQYLFLDDLYVCYVEKANYNFEDLAIWDDVENAFRNSTGKASHLTFPVNDDISLREYLSNLAARSQRERQILDPRPIQAILESDRFRQNMKAFVEGFFCNFVKMERSGKWHISGVVRELADETSWLRPGSEEGILFHVVPAGMIQSDFDLEDEEKFGSLFAEERRRYLKEVISNVQRCIEILGGRAGLIERYNNSSGGGAGDIQSYLSGRYEMGSNKVNEEIFDRDNGFLIQLDKITEFWKEEEEYL